MTPGPVDLQAADRIRVHPLAPGRLRIIVECLAPPPPPHAEPIWAGLCAANPRLHDAPILSITRLDPAAGEIRCEIASYKAFVTGHELGTPIRALGVTGVLWHPARGVPRVLFGRRAANVRIYAGLWETAPRGAARPPAAPGPVPDAYLAQELLHEAREELGEGFAFPEVRPIAAVVDPVASSVDIVLTGAVAAAADLSPASWEYSALDWLELAPAAQRPLTPPTGALVAAIASGALNLTAAASR